MTERDHLDPATIAALVDRTLDPAARAAAEAHLAACADCREVWVETSETADGTSGATAADAAARVVGHRPRLRRWMYGAAGLAAAAAVVLAVFLPQLFGRGDRPEWRALVEAVGENRRTEGRLTGGFKWGPVPSVTRGGADKPSTEVALAVARLQQQADNSSDPETLAAAGVATMIGGDSLAGLSRLREAANSGRAGAAGHSDLAAAYLELARRSGDAQAAEAALREADRALALNPDLAEACFNRALALSRLGRAEARDAWDRYLDLDATSAWAQEARRRRDEFGQGRD